MALFSKPCCSISKMDSILQNSILHFSYRNHIISDMFQYIGGFSLKLASNATTFKEFNNFCKELLHWRMVFFMQIHFTRDVCGFIFLRYFLGTCCINCCGFKMHILKMLLMFQTMPHFLQRVVTLRNGVLYAKSFYKCSL